MAVISEKLKQLMDYYASIPERFDLFFSVEKGTFVTGSVKHVYNALLTLLKEDKLLSEKSTFLDAGSGDGRVCAIANLLGLNSYGIEYNQTIAESSIEHIQQLQNKHILSNTHRIIPKIVQGDFLDESSYKKLGLLFQEINIFFNFVTYHEDLTKKIQALSPKGTIFILHSPCPVKFSPEGFQLLKEIPLTSIYHVIYIYKKN